MAQLKPQRKQRIFRLTPETRLIEEVKEAYPNDGYLYCVALNAKNADKKFIKVINKLKNKK